MLFVSDLFIVQALSKEISGICYTQRSLLFSSVLHVEKLKKVDWGVSMMIRVLGYMAYKQLNSWACLFLGKGG